MVFIFALRRFREGGLFPGIDRKKRKTKKENDEKTIIMLAMAGFWAWSANANAQIYSSSHGNASEAESAPWRMKPVAPVVAVAGNQARNAAKAVVFEERFTDGWALPAGWTTSDGNGDGRNWQAMYGVTATDDGSHCVVSESYLPARSAVPMIRTTG